jgi:hypothetical protein
MFAVHCWKCGILIGYSEESGLCIQCVDCGQKEMSRKEPNENSIDQ